MDVTEYYSFCDHLYEQWCNEASFQEPDELAQLRGLAPFKTPVHSMVPEMFAGNIENCSVVFLHFAIKGNGNARGSDLDKRCQEVGYSETMRTNALPSLKEQRVDRLLADRAIWSQKLIVSVDELNKKAAEAVDYHAFDLFIYPWLLTGSETYKYQKDIVGQTYFNMLMDVGKQAVENSRLPFAVSFDAYDALRYLGFNVLAKAEAIPPTLRDYYLMEKDGFFVLCTSAWGGNGVPSKYYEKAEKAFLLKALIAYNITKDIG